jgi:ribonuclease Z
VTHPVPVAYPAAGEHYWQRLRHASDFFDAVDTPALPLDGTEPAPFTVGRLTVTALPLRHSAPTYGYRVQEPDSVRVDAARLAAAGVSGRAVGQLKARGVVAVGGRTVRLAEFSARRRGQRFAFVMDTGVCDNAVALADGVDLLAVEATYLEEHSALAEQNLHLTAVQAGRIAKEAGVRTLLLTHFSERYTPADDERFRDEAATVFGGEIVLAVDLERVPMPPRV